MRLWRRIFLLIPPLPSRKWSACLGEDEAVTDICMAETVMRSLIVVVGYGGGSLPVLVIFALRIVQT